MTMHSIWGDLSEISDESLLSIRDKMQEGIEEWREEEGFYSGDQGYQDDLYELERFEEEIEKRAI
jgi:hypothetical protein